MLVSGDLVLERELGGGGAATIYAARWRGREVSAKVAHSADDDAAGDVRAEARVLERVSHAALLQVLGTGCLPDGRPYLLLPLLRGEDLAARLARGPLSVPHALEVITAIGGALAALHAAGVLHRDLKPENVFLTDEGVFLLDLGLARNAGARTASLRIRGTYDAMAPERLYGEPATIATEVYELAALAWAALAGALPWPPGAAPSARRWIPPLAIADPMAAALEAALRGALSTVPERRPASAEQLVRALHDASRAAPAAPRERRTVELRDGAEPRAAIASPAVGSILAETYRLVSVLGTGGAGTVFAAEHLRLPRRFAIKILQPESHDPDARARFRREAEIVASLSHPHIVEVFDYDVDEDGMPFMVMELLEGETLRERLRRGPLAVPDVVALIHQAASAVAAAHARGVVHRDLKPSNLFLCRRDGAIDLRVLDFGISKVLGDGRDRTVTGLILGSPGYAAPEQIAANRAAIGPATDVFALAAIAYEALSGVRAFDAATREAVLNQILHGDPLPLEGRGVTRALDEVVRAGLAKRADLRPASAEAFADALATAVAGHRRSSQRRWPRNALAIAIVAVPAVVIAALAVRGPERADAGPSDAAAVAPRAAAEVAAPASPALAAPASPSPSPASSSPASSSSATPSSSAASPATPEAPASASSLPAVPPALPASSPAVEATAASASSSVPRLASVRLVIRPSAARVVIDGALVRGDTVKLSRGHHQLRVTAQGYHPVSRTFDTSTLHGALRVQLRRIPPPAPKQPDLRDLLEK